jgi:hypothetical protein
MGVPSVVDVGVQVKEATGGSVIALVEYNEVIGSIGTDFLINSQSHAGDATPLQKKEDCIPTVGNPDVAVRTVVPSMFHITEVLALRFISQIWNPVYDDPRSAVLHAPPSFCMFAP